MDPGFRSPLVDLFRRGEAAREVRLLAAQGALAPRAYEQIALLVLLSDDPDQEVAHTANSTLDALPREAVGALLTKGDIPSEIRQFFAARGVDAAAGPVDGDAPLVDTLATLPEAAPDDQAEGRLPLSSLPVIDRVKLAMKGTREQRSQLVRDTNRMVAAAVLSSPKLTESEVEQFTKLGNVSEEVLRTIGMNRGWSKNYGVVLGLCRNPKTPPAISMQMIHRLTERDLKMLTTDRNVPEALRVVARKLMTKSRTGH
ncbi:MAG TPA: hypothetical protein VL262_03815 [Vicinamibacterales bacterium]|jgi:hypothetical protein|nr:hypothetical protein [Vicinamibacterales bacterium]